MNREQLVKARADAIAEARGIHQRAQSDGRECTSAELDRVDELMAQADGYERQIEQMDALATPASTPVTPAPAPAPVPTTAGSGAQALDAGAGLTTTPVVSTSGPTNAEILAAIESVHQRSEDSETAGFADNPRGHAEFISAIMRAEIYGEVDERLKPLVPNTPAQMALARDSATFDGSDPRQMRAAVGSDEQMSSSNPHGGFTVPVGFTPRVLQLQPEEDPTRGTTPIPMNTPRVEIPARVDKNHTTSVAGGLVVARRPETVAGPSSRMEMEKVALNANTLTGLAYITDELLRDSAISFAALIQAGFSDAFTDALVRERIEGTGVGEFEGILNTPSLVTVAKESSQTAATIKGANIVKMRSRVWRYSRAVWLANHDCLPQLAEVRLPGDNSDVFLFQPGRGIDVPDTLMGRPVIFTEYAKTLGAKGDLMCVVWSEYLEGTYEGLQTAESMHVRFVNRERALRFTMRNAGAPWWRSALTPANSSSTLSPFVTLAERV